MAATAPDKMPPPYLFVSLVAALASMGQFAIVSYLPAFAEIAQGLHATPAQVQQTLTAYLVPFALTILWHGAISDAIGRRHFILSGLLLFLVASLICTFAANIQQLYAGRVLQGLSAGIGIVVGRAMVRDRFDGSAAQKQMAMVAILFAISPAVAPLCGGWLLLWSGWRSIFAFLAAITAILLLACWRWLPETLAPARRQSLQPLALGKAYAVLLTNRRFLLISLANAGVNSAIYLYVLSAPAFVSQHLGLSPQAFGWLFIPIVSGMILGSLLALRVAGRMDPAASVMLGHALMLCANLGNIGIAASLPPSLTWPILALPLFALGMMLTQPGLQLLALNCFPARLGLASSGYVTVQQASNALSSALLVPFLLGSTLRLALGVAALQLLALLAFWLSQRIPRRTDPPKETPQ